MASLWQSTYCQTAAISWIETSHWLQEIYILIFIHYCILDMASDILENMVSWSNYMDTMEVSTLIISCITTEGTLLIGVVWISFFVVESQSLSRYVLICYPWYLRSKVEYEWMKAPLFDIETFNRTLFSAFACLALWDTLDKLFSFYFTNVITGFS